MVWTGRRRSPSPIFARFEYTSDAMTEIDRFFRKSGKVIVPFTVGEILNEQIAHRVARGDRLTLPLQSVQAAR
jgi:hypothetical protein